MSLPARERGLKLPRQDVAQLNERSLPARERGLKHRINYRESQYYPQSLPARERGLKRPAGRLSGMTKAVAPRAGAWIETILSLKRLQWVTSLPARERGLKLIWRDLQNDLQHVAPRAGAWIETFASASYDGASTSLPARERGLKQYVPICGVYRETRRSPRGSVD